MGDISPEWFRTNLSHVSTLAGLSEFAVNVEDRSTGVYSVIFCLHREIILLIFNFNLKFNLFLIFADDNCELERTTQTEQLK